MFDISLSVLCVSTAGQWWKRETNIVTLVVLCAPTATSTSNRRAISLWRGSCTVRFTLALEWDHRRDTTSSQVFLLHRFSSYKHKQTKNTQTRIWKDTLWPTLPCPTFVLCVYLHFQLSMCNNIFLSEHSYEFSCWLIASEKEHLIEQPGSAETCLFHLATLWQFKVFPIKTFVYTVRWHLYVRSWDEKLLLYLIKRPPYGNLFQNILSHE